MGQLFQSFWWGEPLSPYEWLSLKSFIDFGHGFDLYSFDPHIAVPAQIRVRDVAELAGRAELFVSRARSFHPGVNKRIFVQLFIDVAMGILQSATGRRGGPS